MMTSPIRFYNFFDDLLPPMPADKTAMGTMPASAFQYCESLVSATGHGYHIFPPCDATVRYSGAGIEFLGPDGWQTLNQIALSEEATQKWAETAPPEFQHNLPPFLQRFFVPDTVQVFTGLFVSCDPDWSILIRPIVNVPGNDHVMLYEGIVEADIFQPVPLFINIKFLSKNKDFNFEKYRPLFQVQPIQRAAYAAQNVDLRSHSDADPLDDFPWEGLRQTTRIFTGDAEELALGSYKKLVRSRRKRPSDAP